MFFGVRCGVPQWLQAQLGTLVVPPGPVTRDQGRQCWWLEFVLCTHSAVEFAAAAYVVPRTAFTFIHSGGTREAESARANYWFTGSFRGPGCWCALLWLHKLTLGMHMAVKLMTEIRPEDCRCTCRGPGMPSCDCTVPPKQVYCSRGQ